MPLIDVFQRKGERGSKTVISENRSDLKFIILRRTLAVAGHGLPHGQKELLENRLMTCMRLLQKFKGSHT